MAIFTPHKSKGVKYIIQLLRVIVGLLFIFSGLVKAIDPLGLSYKMQEFFDLWGWGSLNSYTLALSVTMIAFEIVAGVALLLGWKAKWIVWLLLLLIVFFTFLTGYAHFSGKFKNCGCFGDCIPITSKTSFIKDLVLLVMILVLLIGKKFIQPLFSNRATHVLLGISVILSAGLQWYAWALLPPIDCLPFKKGNSIPEKMKPPTGALTDSFAIRYIYEKNGTRYEFSPTELPADFKTYKYIDRIDKLVRKGNAEPPIKGFALRGITGADSTDIILNYEQAILVFVEELGKMPGNWKEKLRPVVELANTKFIPVCLVTTSIESVKADLKDVGMDDLPIFSCDFTAIRTAARSWPTYYLLNRGRVENKWSQRTVFGLLFTLGNRRPLTPPYPEEPIQPDTLSNSTDTLQTP